MLCYVSVVLRCVSVVLELYYVAYSFIQMTGSEGSLLKKLPKTC